MDSQGSIGSMADEVHIPVRRWRRRLVGDEPVDYGPVPPDAHPSITSLGGRHRATHYDMRNILDLGSYLMMLHEWPIQCPQFMDALRAVRLHYVSQLLYIQLDHHLLTVLVERWSPEINTFHFAVGEMTHLYYKTLV